MPPSISRRVERGRCAVAAALFAVLAACGGGGGNSADAGNWVDPNHYGVDAGSSLATPNEATAITHDTATVGGQTIPYTATAGHLTVTDANGAAEASFFHVDYTADGAPAATRPVTFFFNGGPGSSTAWLHLGSWAPKRLQVGEPATTQSAPFPQVANAESLIDTSDLVFVDAVGTGLSEAIAPHRNQDYWSVDADAAVFHDFVLRWLAASGRAASPLFVYGESYGTVRAPLLVRLLETGGTKVAGLVLQSSVLDYNANCWVTGVLAGSCAPFLPSYAAVGHWFGLVSPPPADEAGFLVQMRSYADTTYESEVQSWLQLGQPDTPPPGADVATLVADTGLAATWWDTQFDMDYDTFRHRLIANTVLGVYDGRMRAPVGSALGDDPSNTFVDAPFQRAMQTILPDVLGFTTPSAYVLESDAIAHWDFSHGGRALPDVVPDLATALALDPDLKVLSLGGVHDLITPFHLTELDLARLPAGAPVTTRYHDGGHMTYLDDTSRPLLKADLAAFYATATEAP